MLLEAVAAAGSCVLALSLTELKHTMGWDFFFPVVIYFLKYQLLLERFWQQSGNSYVTPKGSLWINYPLNTIICQMKEGLNPRVPHRAHVSVTQPWAQRGRQVSALCLLKSHIPGPDLSKTWGELWHCEALFGIPGAMQFSVELKIEREVERSDEMSCIHL